MIKNPDINYLQNFLQLVGEVDVLAAWIAITGWMVVGQDHGSGIEPQGLLDHFPRMHRGAVYRTTKHLFKGQQSVGTVQKQTGKHFKFVLANLVLDRSLCYIR